MSERGGGIAGGWRIVLSAWVVAIGFAMLFAAVQAVASRQAPSPERVALAGAVVPRHDPACAGPRIPNASAEASDECSLSSSLVDRMQAEAYTGW